MLHDITHCRNEKCILKGTCYRYQAHLEAIERKLEYLSYFVEDKIPIDGSCTSYWKI